MLECWGRHRDKVSVIAALTVSPARRRVGLYFATDPGSYITAAGVAAFLRDLLRHLRGRVIVVWDRGSNHRGPAVRAVLRRHPRLAVGELPAYAPDLNPVEPLWSHLKHGLMANFVPEGLSHLWDAVLGHLSDARHEPQRLRAIWEGSDLPFPGLLSLPVGQ